MKYGLVALPSRGWVKVEDVKIAINNIKNQIINDYDLKDAILIGELLDKEFSQSNPTETYYMKNIEVKNE